MSDLTTTPLSDIQPVNFDIEVGDRVEHPLLESSTIVERIIRTGGGVKVVDFAAFTLRGAQLNDIVILKNSALTIQE